MKQIYTALLLFICSLASTQVTYNHNFTFSSGPQYMWGPGNSPFNINQNTTLFEESWNETGGTSQIATVAGLQFGGAINGFSNGTIGSRFRVEGFTLGTVDVDYPVEIDITKPTDFSYNQGETISLLSDYQVSTTGFKLETVYPNAGTMGLDFYFNLGFGLNTTLCAFGCSPAIPIVPAFNTGTQTINVFELSQNNGLSFASGLISYPNPLPVNIGLYPPLADWGIQGTFDIPNVVTSDALNSTTKNLTATGSSTYVDDLGLELFAFAGQALTVSGFPPAVAVGQVLGNLSGGQDLGASGALTYTILSASLGVDLINNQQFTFDPLVFGNYALPVPVNYTVNKLDGSSQNGFASDIDFVIGETVDIDFPCQYEELPIIPTYSTDGKITNRTFDQIIPAFSIEVLSANFSLPSIQITPEINVPRVCIPYGYPCGFVKWCSGQTCTPAFTIPSVNSPAFSFSIGPAYAQTFNIATISYDWVNRTWELEGFSDTTFAPMILKANTFSATETHTDIACFGDSTGSITVATVNGTAPFTYLWSNGATTQNLTNVPAGNYNVTITDANGCEAYIGATLSQPAQPISITHTKVDDACFGSPGDGSINITAEGGTGNSASYSYQWLDLATNTTPNRLNLVANDYTVTVTDLNGCTQSKTITINEPNLLTDSIVTISDVSCFNGSDGKVELFMTGGTLPYSYSWSNGTTNQNLLNAPAGTYTLNTTDGNGCQFSEDYAISEPATPLTLSTSATNVDCFGNTNGSATVNASGGTSPYTYSWTNGANQIINQTTATVTNLAAGLYTVTATDTNNCVSSTSAVIFQPLAPLSATANLTAVDCKGNSSGSIDLTVSGGTSAYTFNWNNGDSTEDLVGISAGNYAVTITDANGCSESYTFTITEPAENLNTVFTTNNVLCFGENTGSITTSTTGGTAPYTYLWNTGQTSSNITGLVANNYSLTITDNNNCTNTINPTINEPAQALTLSESNIDVSCFGGANGSIDLSVIGGTAPYSFEWFNASNTTLTEISEDLVNLSSNTYTVVSTDANNCSETISILISEPVAPISLTHTIDNVNCNGGSDGAINITTLGGTPGYTFSWSNGMNTEDLSNVSAGDYTLTVTDNLGCTFSETFTVTEPINALSGIVTTESVLCFGDAKGSVDLTVSGGTAPYTYLWNNGSPNQNLSNIVSGMYTVTITDAQGCTSSVGGFVSQPANPLTVIVNVTDPSCYLFEDGTIDLTVSGGSAPYSFSWGNQSQFLMNNPSETLNNVSAGDYILKVNDRYNCSYEEIVTVNQPDTIEVAENIIPVSCFNGNDGEIDVTVIGGTTPYQFNWSNSTTTEDNFNLLSNSYELTVTDNQNCTYTRSYFVEQPTEIMIIETITKVSCIDQVDGTISVETSGGTPPYNWLWTTGEYTDFIEGLAPGMYGLEITDNNNCLQSYDFVVPENALECLTIPNTFTPNGDNYNDVWNIKNLYLYPDATVQIYNRWGNLLYEANGDYTPWDGIINGEQLPAAVYYYVIVLENDINNKYTGTITIIR